VIDIDLHSAELRVSAAPPHRDTGLQRTTIFWGGTGAQCLCLFSNCRVSANDNAVEWTIT
jgi:hypothetical protein